MKYLLFISVLFLLIGCSSQNYQLEYVPENPYSTPESLIITITNDLFQHKTKNYVDRSYFSPLAKDGLVKMNSSYEVFIEDFENRVKSTLPITKIKLITFTNKTTLNETKAILQYTVYFEDELLEPLKDKTYFVKFDDGWYIDVEPELLALGFIAPPNPPQVSIPEDAKDCGHFIEGEQDKTIVGIHQCFADEFVRDCTPVKFTITRTGFEDGVSKTITVWTHQAEECEIHAYAPEWMPGVPAYIICDDWVPKHRSDTACKSAEGYLQMDASYLYALI